jgi:epoxyqueuosine reductase
VDVRERIKETVLKHGADLFGIAPVARFDGAPEGFHPRNVYFRTESVIVFAIGLPTESLFAESQIPFTHTNALAIQKVDAITYAVSADLDRDGIKNVLIPTDDPYEHWDSGNQEGRGILSLRHAAMLAGLGKLGRNNLLINKKYGNMIQIGALLTNQRIEPDPLADYDVCPPECRICLDSCPQRALTGETVIQKLCRPISNFRTEKGYVVKKCFECRKKCPMTLGVQ